MKGHYGIDPRKRGVVVPPNKLNQSLPNGGMSKKYNPYLVMPNMNGGNRLRSSLAVPYQDNKDKVKNIGKIIDKVFQLSHSFTLDVAFEESIGETIDASLICVWFYNEEKEILYCPKLAKSSTIKDGILGFCYRTKEIILSSSPKFHECYDINIDGSEFSLLYLPFLSDKKKVLCVIQICRDTTKPTFSDAETERFYELSQKFTPYAKLLFSNSSIAMKGLLMDSNTENDKITSTLDRLKRFFRARSIDLFAYNITEGTYSRFNNSTLAFESIGQTAGFASSSLRNGIQMNLENIKLSSDYNRKIDGDYEECAICQPLAGDMNHYAIVLRGNAFKRPYSASEASSLLFLSPLISNSMFKNDSTNEQGTDFAKRLRALLEVAEILSGVLDIEALVPTIMKKASELLNTERCSLFLVDHGKQELVTRFHGGLDKSIRIPINRGIVGQTATTGKIITIADAYSDDRFDKTVDKLTGFRTKNLLSLPIYNNRGDIAGVTEMINKIGSDGFNDEDIKMMMAFNVFCGISLDNARLYQASLDLTHQLRSFVELSTALNKTKSISSVIEEILINSRTVIHVNRVTVFLVENDHLTPLVSLGDPIVHGTLIADKVRSEMKSVMLDSDDILDMNGSEIDTTPTSLKDTKPLRGSSDSIGSNASRVSSVFDQNVLLESTSSVAKATNESICGFPLVTNEGKLLGVMEFSSFSKILKEDMKLMDCFAVFAAVSLERSELNEIATLGQLEKTIKEYISPNERSQHTIPEKLKIANDQQGFIFTIHFDAPKWEGIGLFKVLWHIFDNFKLLSTFNISNEKFFKFLTEISSTYKKVPYHNWRHVVDVTQFISYQITISNLQNYFTAFELFGLLVAAICHDANHDGFTNTYNIKAETPLGILFKNQSVMETHHCAIAISVISKEECNIFSSLSTDEFKNMWTLIIQLILSTDMAKHHTMVQAANEELDKGPVDLKNAAHRLLVMGLLLKCADISNVSRPFEMANQWSDVLCEEFFRQGDLEKTHGMEYTSPLNDREHLDKPKSQIGFYTYVCLPLFETASRAVPQLDANVKQIKSNLDVWKNMSK